MNEDDCCWQKLSRENSPPALPKQVWRRQSGSMNKNNQVTNESMNFNNFATSFNLSIVWETESNIINKKQKSFFFFLALFDANKLTTVKSDVGSGTRFWQKGLLPRRKFVEGASTELPPVAAFVAKDKRGHRFVGRPRLYLVVSTVALLALAALEKIRLRSLVLHGKEDWALTMT